MLVLDLGGVSLNDITTASYLAQIDPARFITIGLNDVQGSGNRVMGGVRLAGHARRARAVGIQHAAVSSGGRSRAARRWQANG